MKKDIAIILALIVILARRKNVEKYESSCLVALRTVTLSTGVLVNY